MTIAEAEKILVSFLKSEVAEKIKLKQSETEIDVNKPLITYKEPYVSSGFFVPIINEIMDEEETSKYYPNINVILESDIFEKEENILTFNIVFGVYCYGEYKDGVFIQDGSGYHDLQSLAQKTKEALFKNKIIEKKIVVENYFNFYIPLEQSLPFWQGVATIKVKIPNINYTGGI